MATVTSYTQAKIDDLLHLLVGDLSIDSTGVLTITHQDASTEVVGSVGTDWAVIHPSGDTTGADDVTNIQSALNAAATSGGVVYLASGIFYINATLTITGRALLLGSNALDVTYVGDHGTVLKLTAAFTGGAAVVISNGANGSTFAPAGSVSNFSIEGSAHTSSAVDGIQGLGNCIRAIVSKMMVGGMSGYPFRTMPDTTAPSGQQLPMFWEFQDVLYQACALGGPYEDTLNDSYHRNVYSLGCGGSTADGWTIINGAANSRFDNCRSEWGGRHGLYFTGTVWNGNGSGGTIFNSFSTDRSDRDGVKIDATGASAPIIFNNLMLRRDGRNNKTGGGGYSGLNISSTTLPVVVGTVTCYPGVDDDNTGTNSPQNGISISGSASVSIGSGYVQANTTPLNLGSLNTYVYTGPGIVTATGPTTAPATVNGNAEHGRDVALTGMPAAALTGVTTLQSLMTGLTVPANGAYAGQTYEFDIWGLITTTAGTQTVTLATYLGGTAGTKISDTGAAQPNSGGAVTNVPFRFKGKIQFQSGTAVTVTTELFMNYFLTTMGVAQTTVTTTAAKAFAIGYTPSATGVSLTIQGGTFRRSMN